MRDLLKWGLVLGGVGFFFKDQIASALGVDEQPSVAPPTGTTQPPVTTLPAPAPPSTQPPAVIPPPVYVPPPPTPPANPSAVSNLPVTDELIKKATWDYQTAVILGSRVLLNTHEWNWFREQSGKGNPGTDFTNYGYGDPAQPITATEYQAKLRTGGLAGIQSNRWREAWR